MNLEEAQKQVAQDWREMAWKTRTRDEYASHVTFETKEQLLLRDLNFADEIEKGLHNGNFTVMQRIRTVMTGKCEPLFPK